MKKRFIVLAESASPAQKDRFLTWIKSRNLGWWHWFQDAWLLVESSGSLSAAELRDGARECFENGNILVLELDSARDTWAGYGPSAPNRSMFKWLKRNWRKD